MSNFSQILTELMEDAEIDAKTLAKELGMKEGSLISLWRNNKTFPRLNYAIMLADYFKVSLDYLFGRTSEFETKEFKPAPDFDIQLKKIMKEKNKTQYRMIKIDKVCNCNNIFHWFNKKSSPSMINVIKLANYFGVTLDYLVGRE